MKRSIRLLVPLLVAWSVVAGAQSGPAPDADPRIEKLVASVSVDHLRQMLTTLAGFGTRNTLSDTTSSTRGIGAARQWIFDELQRSSPKLRVSFDTYRVAPQGRITQEVEVRNVMGVLPGRSSRRIYVTGHYDSLNIPDQTRNIKRPTPLPAGFDAMAQPGQDFNVDAAGANDDGSGTVLTMELARRFAESGIDFDATLVFICWAGEEQGLIGSTAHAQRLAGENATVEAMFDNDIVGNSRGGNGIVDGASVRVYSDGPEDSMSRSLAPSRSCPRCTSHRIGSGCSRGRLGSGGAAITRRSTASAFRLSSFARRTKTTRNSIRPTTCRDHSGPFRRAQSRVRRSAAPGAVPYSARFAVSRADALRRAAGSRQVGWERNP